MQTTNQVYDVSIQGQGHFPMNIETCFFFSETTVPFLTKFCMYSFRYMENEID